MECPICGGPLVGGGTQWIKDARTLVRGASVVRLSKKQTELFDFLWEHRKNGHFYSAQQLADHVYRDEWDGGPLHAGVCIRIAICRMRARIKGIGVTVIATLGDGGGYRIGHVEPVKQ